MENGLFESRVLIIDELRSVERRWFKRLVTQSQIINFNILLDWRVARQCRLLDGMIHISLVEYYLHVPTKCENRDNANQHCK